MKRKLLFSLLGLSLLLSVQSLPAKAAPALVKVSIVQPDGDPTADAMRQVFKPFIEEKTQGRFQVDVYTGGALGNSDTVFQGIQFGTLHMATESLSNLSQFAPDLSVTDMPYLFPDIPSIDRVFSKDVGKRLLASLAKTGVIPLRVIPSTFRCLATTKELHTLADIQGLKLRATASKRHIEAIKALGMNPTPMAASEMITGIQQGVVQGADTTTVGLIAYRFCDVAKYVLLSEHVPVTYVLYGNSAWWNKLSPEDRAIFEEGVRLYHDATQVNNARVEAEVLAAVQKDHGVKVSTLSPEEKQRWIAKVQPAYDALPDNLKKLAQEIQEATKE